MNLKKKSFNYIYAVGAGTIKELSSGIKGYDDQKKKIYSEMFKKVLS